MKSKFYKYILGSTAAIALTLNASAGHITITSGISGGNSDTTNVLFNDADTVKSGAYVDGNFSGTASDYFVRFTSESGMIEGSGGQATIVGLDGNDPFTSLTFGLLEGATFTKGIFNPDATVSGTIDFSVSVLGIGGTYMETFSLSGNGQNFFTIIAADGTQITSITFSTTDSAFSDASQFRLGGFDRPSTQVPDASATSILILLGLGAIGLFGRRKL